MSTTADISSGVVQRASDMPISTLVQIMNDDIRNDIREEFYATFPDSVNKHMLVRMYKIGALTPTLGSVAGSIENGDYRYKVSFITGGYETMVGARSSIVTVIDNTSAGKVDITGIPTGGDDVTGRRIYRQQGGVGDYPLLTTISDNTTTTYTDNSTQASLVGIAKCGTQLPFNFYDILELKDGRQTIRIKRKSADSTGSRQYAWIDYGDKAGSTTAVADNGSTQPRFTSAEHGLQTGEKVTLSGHTDVVYNQTDVVITRISRDEFDVTSIVFTATDTGQWTGEDKMICFDPDHPWNNAQELTLIYQEDIADVTETGVLPYPRALHGRLLPIFRLGSAFFYLAAKPGNQDSDQVAILQERYTNAKANVFIGSISQEF